MTNKKELFLKEIKHLFYLQCAAIICIFLAWIPTLTSVIGWVNIAISVGILFVLFKLAPIQTRYRKAAIFMIIVVVLNLLTRFIDSNIVSFVSALFLIMAIYQEYYGHSEMMADVDEKLSKNWHGLFYAYFIGSIVVVLLSASIVVALSALFFQYGITIVVVTLILSGGFDLIIKIVYLFYLKRTYAAYENYEGTKEI